MKQVLTFYDADPIGKSDKLNQLAHVLLNYDDNVGNHKTHL